MRHNDWDELEQPEDLPPIDWNKLYERETTSESIQLTSADGNTGAENSADNKGQSSQTAGAGSSKRMPEKSPKNSKPERNGTKLNGQPTIMGIIAEAKQKDKNTTSYSALKTAGIILELSSVINPDLKTNGHDRNGSSDNDKN